MAEFKFFCPQCGQHIQCDIGYSGNQIDCPICKQAIAVPQPPRAAAAARPPVVARSRTLRNVLVITAAVVVLAGLVIVGWFGFSKIKMHIARGHLPPGLVSLWSGEGNANDSVGGNNGTLSGSAKYGPSRLGQGFVFNGENGSGVMLGNPDNLQLQDFTIEAWIKRTITSVVSYSSGTSAIIFGYGTGGYLLYLASNGQLNFDKLGDIYPLTGPSITDMNFHHVALTKSGSTVVFYLDGVAYATPAYNGNFTFTGGPAIGCLPASGDDGFLGTIDEVSLYNRALSPAEIETIYKAE